MRRMITGLLCLVLLPAFASASQLGSQRWPLFHALEEAFARDGTLGSQVVLMKHGEIVYSYTQGVAVTRPESVVCEDTLFRMASVTKMVTAVGIMRLVEKGVLSLDADIGEYLGYEVRNPRYPETPITVRHLLSHTSGIRADREYAEKEGSGRKTLCEMLHSGEAVASNFLDMQPGETYEYTNFGAGVLGSIIETVTGKSVQGFMEEEVFAPLGINGYFHPSYVPEGKTMATLYRMSNETRAWDPYRIAEQAFITDCYPEDHYDLAAGNLMMTASDLSKVVGMLCNGGELNGVRVLSPQSVDEMCCPQTGRGSVWGESAHGLGVTIRTDLLRNRTLYGHQGVYYDSLCYAFFDLESGGTVVVMTNATQKNSESGKYGLTSEVLQVCFAALDRI